jgi:hypothetical protein
MYVDVVVAVKNSSPFDDADPLAAIKVPEYELVDVMRIVAAFGPAFPFDIRPRSTLYCCPTTVESVWDAVPRPDTDVMRIIPLVTVAVPVAAIVHPVVPLLKSPFVSNSDPSTSPLDLSKRRPTVCPGVVTGVVPARSWNMVVRSDGSYQTPSEPDVKMEAGLNPVPISDA